MNSNDLNKRIEVWKYDYSDNDAGTPIEQFLFYRNKYANMRVRSGGTNNTELGNLPFTNVDFTIRYDSKVDYRCQIKYNNKSYNIEHIEVIGRKAWMKIITTVNNELM